MRFVEQQVVLDTTRGRVGRIIKINGACLVIGRPSQEPWDALTSWCTNATLAERQQLECEEHQEQEVPAA
ncbi:hypothetical protein ACJ6WD_10785 [Streptomyces sp. VTCC 41912]|uniref:hypothetical protein n=1 Tax=Streptomyces sp. VTCC 41912 TaxID=3383243 RepID=UPI003896E448